MNHLLKYQIDLKDGTFSRVMSRAQEQTGKLDSMIKNMATGLGSYFAASSLMSYGKQAVETSAKVEGLENAIRFASKSEREGAANLLYLSELTEKHGSNLLAATQGYKTFLGSMQGVPYTMEQIRKMYTQVDIANRVMNLSAEDSQGVYLALGQIMSKGKVQAEELRGQIGERIPGAFAIAARAMGVSQQRLNKMMEDGDLMAVDFLPRFANELEKTFGSGLEKATNSFLAQSNRRENALLQEEKAIGEKLQPAYLSLMDLQFKAIKLGGQLIDFYDRNKTGIDSLFLSLATITTAYTAYNSAIKINTFLTGLNVLGNKSLVTSQLAAALGAGVLERAWIALSTSVSAMPWAWAAAGVGVLVGAFAYFSKSTKQIDSLTDSMARQKSELNANFSILKQLNPANENRKKIISDINSKYGEYLPKLLSEKSTLKEIADAQWAANQALEAKINLQAKEQIIAGKMKTLVDMQKSVYDMEYDLAHQNTVGAVSSPEMRQALQQRISLAKAGIKDMMADLDAMGAKFGIKTGGNKYNLKKESNQTLSSSKSVRNVVVNIDSLVKEMKNYFQEGGVGDNKTTNNIREQMTKLLVGIVRDSEIALG